MHAGMGAGRGSGYVRRSGLERALSVFIRPEWRVMPGREWKTIQDDGVLKRCWSIREMYSRGTPRQHLRR